MSGCPVITIDGPSGCGKGTLALRMAETLNWPFLDSGALYRAVAWAVLQEHFDLAHHANELGQFIQQLKIEFRAADHIHYQLFCNSTEITHEIRTEACGGMASQLGAIPVVRASLLQLQRDFRIGPGLITDGRDMGSVIFPDAILKFFLTASAAKRAERRHLQLKKLGIDASLPQILQEIVVRDERDQNRAISPLKPTEDMIVLDTSQLNADEVFRQAMEKVNKVL